MENTTTISRHSKLLSRKGNAKIDKNDAVTWSLSLAQGNLSGHEVCPHRTNGCTMACVGSAGLAGVFPTVMKARIAKTQLFFKDRLTFLSKLSKELALADKYCAKNGIIGKVRLNTFSDIGWESQINLSAFTNLRFYDYTKNQRRVEDMLANNPRYRNYRLCYSVNENTNNVWLDGMLKRGGIAAVVFHDVRYVPSAKIKDDFPPSYRGHKVVDGDVTDDRTLDPAGSVVGLRLKGTNKARKIGKDSGFARKSDFVTLTVSK